MTTDLLGVPVGVMVDLGTDLPLRGQRNSVRFSFDPGRAVDKERWADAREMHDLNSLLDSLELERASTMRMVMGNEARLAALRDASMYHTLPHATNMDTVALMPSEVNLGHDTLMNGYGNPAAMLGTPGKGIDPDQLEGMELALEGLREKLALLDTELGVQRMRQQRLRAAMNAAQGPDGLATRIARGIKRLDVGSCSPSSSEFLINGLNFQGISFEYEHKELFIAFDRGRSFDDTWMDADPVARNVRLLQQSLFFIDAQDLNPRKLTAVRAGFGEVRGTHLHAGYLYGTRADLPFGSTQPVTPGPTLRNHVVEIDAGYAVRKGHVLRMVYARSLVLLPAGLNENDGPSSVGDLFSTDNRGDQAVKLGWSSMFERTRTRAALELRSISPWFQSFGMGFVRNGSRVAEARVEQSVGKKLRVRGRYTLEDRLIPGNGAGQVMTLQRGQVLASFRPIRALTLRAGHMPVVTRLNLPGGAVETYNLSWSAGGDYRKRWRSLVALISMDGAHYGWWTSEGERQEVTNHTATLSLLKGERWHTRLSWTGMSGMDALHSTDSIALATSNVGVHAGYRTKKGATADAAVNMPDRGRVGWMGALGLPLRSGLTLRIKGESYSRSDVCFSTMEWTDRISDYTWTVSAIYAW